MSREPAGVFGGSVRGSWALGLAGAALVAAATVPWSWLLDVFDRASWTRVVLVVVAVACLVASFRLRPVYYYSPEMPPGARSMGTISAWWMLVGACAVVAAMWITTAWLFDVTAALPAGAGQTTARVEAIRTGLTAAGGVGAATALMLAFRRQRHLEANAIGVEFDASEKRVTELYVKASEQLGSDKAAVRMAGLFSLERLGQGNPDHRQTVADLLCAYLRMPLPSGTPEALVEEEQVRRAAQNVLGRHLRIPDESTSPGGQLWADTDLDLTGAVLFDWNFHRCATRHAKFIRARFSGEAFFGAAHFSGFAVFGGATFERDAWFAGAEFAGDAWFVDVTFLGDAIFTGADFRAAASLRGTTFHSGVRLDAAAFREPVELEGASTFVSRADVRLPAGWTTDPAGTVVPAAPPAAGPP